MRVISLRLQARWQHHMLIALNQDLQPSPSYICGSVKPYGGHLGK